MSVDRHQYGSIKGSSTTHCLIELLDVLYRGTDKCNTVGSLVVTDFSKAFDCVDHTLAIKSLYDLGVRAEIIPWIAYFLTSRRQRVQYQSETSAWETLTCGVPQGTKFGPITFIGMIDSAASDSKTHTFKYVDDLSLAEVRPATPINLARLKRMFKTLMTGLTVTTSNSIPLSVRLCRCAS